jgi:integrase
MAKRKNLLGTIYHNTERGTYRFRHGRSGGQKVFKKKREALDYQLEYSTKIKTEGTEAINSLKMSKEIKEAVELLVKNELPASCLKTAVERYIKQTNPSNRHLSFSDALDVAMKTNAFKKLVLKARANNRQQWQALEIFVGTETKLADVTTDKIREFIEKKCIPSMQHRYYTSINALWEKYFIKTSKLTKYNPLSDYVEPPTKPPVKPKAPYTQEETFRLLDAVESPVIDRTDIASLARAMYVFPKLAVALNIAFFTGIRISEVCRLQIKDFMRGKEISWDNPKEAYIHLPANKTKKEDIRDAYMPPCLIKYLRNNTYFNSLSPEDKIYPQNADTLNRYTKEVCLEAGVPWKTTAVSRKTFATHANKSWLCKLDVIQKQLGHTTSEMTIKSYMKYASEPECVAYFQRGL